MLTDVPVSCRMVGAAFTTIPIGFISFFVAKIFVNLIQSIAHNPSAKDKVFSIGMMAFALTEALALFCLAVIFLILFSDFSSTFKGLPLVRIISASIASFPIAIVAYSVSRIFITLINSIARNPSIREKVFSVGMMAFALTEALGLFCLAVIFLILFVALPGSEAVQMFKMVTSAMICWPIGFVSLGVGKIFVTLLESIAHNSSVKPKIFSVGMMSFALTEALGLFCLAVIFLILFM